MKTWKFIGAATVLTTAIVLNLLEACFLAQLVLLLSLGIAAIMYRQIEKQLKNANERLNDAKFDIEQLLHDFIRYTREHEETRHDWDLADLTAVIGDFPRDPLELNRAQARAVTVVPYLSPVSTKTPWTFVLRTGTVLSRTSRFYGKKS